METKIVVMEAEWGRGIRLQQWPTHEPDAVANLAMNLCARWGGVAGKPGEEDSAGRATVALQTPEELVKRAFDIAEGIYAEAFTRGHMITLPTLEEAEADIDSKRKKN